MMKEGWTIHRDEKGMISNQAYVALSKCNKFPFLKLGIGSGRFNVTKVISVRS
jgi:hypothetical protein